MIGKIARWNIGRGDGWGAVAGSRKQEALGLPVGLVRRGFIGARCSARDAYGDVGQLELATNHRPCERENDRETGAGWRGGDGAPLRKTIRAASPLPP